MKNNSTRIALSPITSYIIKAPSLRSSQARYDILKAIANKYEAGDTFISEDLKDVVDYMTLGAMVCDMRRSYNLNVLSTVIRHGEKIMDRNGKCLGKTTCNVYKVNIDSDELKRELAKIPVIIAGMFN